MFRRLLLSVAVITYSLLLQLNDAAKLHESQGSCEGRRSHGTRPPPNYGAEWTKFLLIMCICAYCIVV